MSRVRAIFMGSDAIALDLLEVLAEEGSGVELVEVVTQPDRRTGRGMRLQESEIKKWALHRDLPVRQPERLGSQDEEELRALGVEVAFVMAFGQILRRTFLEIPRLGCWNYHASLLPKLRGPSPIHTAIALGDRRAGVSMMRIVPRLDAGPVLDQEAFPVDREAQAPAVIANMRAACGPLTRRCLPMILGGTARPQEQEEERATYCRILTKDDAHLDFTQPAGALHDRIRAFQPWPGALLPLPGVVLRIGSAREVTRVPRPPGSLEVEGSRAFVHTASGCLELLELQRPAGRMLPTPEFLNGFPLPHHFVVPSRPMEGLVFDRPYRRKTPEAGV